MLPSSEVVISDTSCLILLSKIDEVQLLSQIFHKIYITSTIQKEYGMALPEWILVKDPKDIHYQKILEMDLDSGEASALALSLEIENALVLIDDLKGRKIAQKLNIRFSGTLGFFLKAKELGVVEKVKPFLDKIQGTNFRFSPYLIETLLKEANE